MVGWQNVSKVQKYSILIGSEVDSTRHLSKFCLYLATSYPKCPFCFVWYGDFSLFFSLVYKNMGGFTPAEGLFTAKSVRLITMVPQSTQSRHFIGTYSQVSWWGVFVGHVKVICSSACVHRQSRYHVLTPRQTAGRTGPEQVQVQVWWWNSCPVSFQWRRRSGVEVEVAPSNNSRSLEDPPPAVVMTPCVVLLLQAAWAVPGMGWSSGGEGEVVLVVGASGGWSVAVCQRVISAVHSARVSSGTLVSS